MLKTSHRVALLDFPFGKILEVLRQIFFCSRSSSGFVQQQGSKMIYGSKSPSTTLTSPVFVLFFFLFNFFPPSLLSLMIWNTRDTCSWIHSLILMSEDVRDTACARESSFSKVLLVLFSVRRHQQSSEQEPQCALNYLQLQQLSVSSEPFTVPCLFITAPLP